MLLLSYRCSYENIFHNIIISPPRLTYKSEKEKKDLIRDLIDYSLVLPTIELHNKTCTWLDLLIIIKLNARQSLLSQAIRQKLLIKVSNIMMRQGAYIRLCWELFLFPEVFIITC